MQLTFGESKSISLANLQYYCISLTWYVKVTKNLLRYTFATKQAMKVKASTYTCTYVQ